MDWTNASEFQILDGNMSEVNEPCYHISKTFLNLLEKQVAANGISIMLESSFKPK